VRVSIQIVTRTEHLCLPMSHVGDIHSAVEW
jgi:hypothetical protein